MSEDNSEIVCEQSESVEATNLKVLGDAPAFYQSQGFATRIVELMNTVRDDLKRE